ncbi:Hypothetical protein CINCED_3A015169 [Cinara cedri]|uniref:peptidyl-tRNA hydrolase n=1 Tax=Cinara cedri TaxID=506608 RepID=A0A5E4MVJ1_9HEMI|nr:Hypothetical protein CINCED_3A015169 [Cinara cedri]
MFWVTDTFFKGITIGILIGLSLHTIINYVFKNKWSRLNNKITDKNLQKSNSSTKVNGEFKMALLVRHDLKMGKGKVAAQCSHAIVHCYEESLRLNPKEINAWESNNKPVDIFKIADEETMLNYQKVAIDKKLNTYIVVDAGRTQVAPRSKTVMAIGPAPSEHINLFTKNLQAYI